MMVSTPLQEEFEMVKFLLGSDPAIGAMNERRLERYAEAIREHEASRIRAQAALELLNRETSAAHAGIAAGTAAAKAEAETHVRDLHTKLDVASAAVDKAGRLGWTNGRRRWIHIEANQPAGHQPWKCAGAARTAPRRTEDRDQRQF